MIINFCIDCKTQLKENRAKRCKFCANKGCLNPNWKRGWTINDSGYKIVYEPKHPMANSNRIKEHRLVMEKYLGRFLESWEQVHHWDGNKTNNKIENLTIMSRSEHSSLHMKQKWAYWKQIGFTPGR